MSPTDPQNTSTVTADANFNAQQIYFAAAMNNQLIANYTLYFNNVALSVVDGKLLNPVYPTPPLGYITQTDPNTGLLECVLGTSPVCSPLTPPVVPTPLPVPPPGNADIGKNIPVSGQPSAYFQVGPMDSWPVGKETPPGAKSADGVVGIFLRLGSACGAGWWEKVG